MQVTKLSTLVKAALKGREARAELSAYIASLSITKRREFVLVKLAPVVLAQYQTSSGPVVVYESNRGNAAFGIKKDEGTGYKRSKVADAARMFLGYLIAGSQMHKRPAIDAKTVNEQRFSKTLKQAKSNGMTKKQAMALIEEIYS